MAYRITFWLQRRGYEILIYPIDLDKFSPFLICKIKISDKQKEVIAWLVILDQAGKFLVV